MRRPGSRCNLGVRTKRQFNGVSEREGGSGASSKGTMAGHTDPAKVLCGNPPRRESQDESAGAVWREVSREAVPATGAPRREAGRVRACGRRVTAEAAAAGTGERRVPALPLRGERASYRLSSALRRSAAALGLGFCNWQLAFFFSPPLFLSLLLLDCSTPPRIRRGGNQLGCGCQLAPSASANSGSGVPRPALSPRGALSSRPRAPRLPHATLPHFSPLLQSHGILRMPERWR